ncbi:MAG: stringent starvation protein B, partial [Burkholderiaceae bacterium]
MSEISTKPYMLRAIYEWCTDNGYTPYLAVKVDGQTRVPTQFVKNGEIVLNISFEATSGLKMEND